MEINPSPAGISRFFSFLRDMSEGIQPPRSEIEWLVQNEPRAFICAALQLFLEMPDGTYEYMGLRSGDSFASIDGSYLFKYNRYDEYPPFMHEHIL